jgi:anoctamin-10/anoctamin-7
LFIYKGTKENDEIIVLLKSSLERLRAFADKTNFVFKLDPAILKNSIESGNATKNISPVEISHRPDITLYEPYDFIFGKYSRKVDESLYWRPKELDNPFRDIVKLKLNTLILQSRLHGSENLKIRRYLKNKWLLGCFPLHNRTSTEILQREWFKYPFQPQPLNLVKEYFGEKVTLYFCFLDHYTQFLSIPAFIGIPLQIAVFATGDYSAPFLPPYSFFLAIWAVFMLEVIFILFILCFYYYFFFI